MPLKLYRKRGSPNWYIRGTVRGITVDESSRVAEKSAAEAIRIQREAECLQASVFGRKATVSFLQAAVSYMEQGGERRFVGPLIEHFGTCALASIDQAAIERAAKLLCPKAAPSTVNRQIHTPISSILKHAADRGWCEYRRIERPKQPKGRIRWLTPGEADRLIQACSEHLRPLVTFLFYTGARLSEALYLDWRQVDLARGEVQFLETKNGEPRGVPLHQTRCSPNYRLSSTGIARCSDDPTGAPMPVKRTAADRSKRHSGRPAVVPESQILPRTTVGTLGRHGTTPSNRDLVG